MEGRITVASASPVLDALNGETTFDITAQLKKGETKVSVDFAECQLTETSFSLGTGGHGEATLHVHGHIGHRGIVTTWADR